MRLPRKSLSCRSAHLLGHHATAVEAHHLLSILVHGRRRRPAARRGPVESVSAEAELPRRLLLIISVDDLRVGQVHALVPLQCLRPRRLAEHYKMRPLLALSSLQLSELMELPLRGATARFLAVL